jgi:hypothetical protein
MCTGRFVRFFCPEAIAANKLCPHFDPICQGMTPYAQLWVQTKFVCCNGHFGDCVDCPLLYRAGNVEYQDGSAVECPECSKRLREGRAGETAETVMKPTPVEGEDTYVMVAAEREDAYMADSEGDSDGGSEGGSDGDSESSGASYVSASENMEMTDADAENMVDEDKMDVEFGNVCGCQDCADFDIVCGCKDCMEAQ